MMTTLRICNIVEDSMVAVFLGHDNFTMEDALFCERVSYSVLINVPVGKELCVRVRKPAYLPFEEKFICSFDTQLHVLQHVDTIYLLNDPNWQFERYHPHRVNYDSGVNWKRDGF